MSARWGQHFLPQFVSGSGRGPGVLKDSLGHAEFLKGALVCAVLIMLQLFHLLAAAALTYRWLMHTRVTSLSGDVILKHASRTVDDI